MEFLQYVDTSCVDDQTTRLEMERILARLYPTRDVRNQGHASTPALFSHHSLAKPLNIELWGFHATNAEYPMGSITVALVGAPMTNPVNAVPTVHKAGLFFLGLHEYMEQDYGRVIDASGEPLKPWCTGPDNFDLELCYIWQRDIRPTPITFIPNLWLPWCDFQ